MPYKLLENQRIKAPAHDVENFIRHTLGKRFDVTIEKIDMDDTGAWYELRFKKLFSLDYKDSNDNPIYINWGMAEIVKYEKETKVTIRSYSPPDWYVGEMWPQYKSALEVHNEWFTWLEELSDKILIEFGEAEEEKTKAERATDLPYCPKKGSKSYNRWQANWRKVKSYHKSGEGYKVLADKADVSIDTISKIVKAGDADLLD